MTRKELWRRLKNLRYLKVEIERYNNKIIELREIATQITAQYSEAPSGSGESDIVGKNASDIAYYMFELKKARMQRIKEEQKLMRYVEQITDTRVRLMVELYYLDWHTWNEVADKIGGGNTEDTCRMAVKRYFQKKGGELDD